MGRKKIDPERRARYKEIARRIVGADRSSRRLGTSQNTIGDIERALVAAFREGFETSKKFDPDQKPENLTWTQVPPRCRDTLISMTFSFSSLLGPASNEVSQIERSEQSGKTRWRTVDGKGRRSEKSVADGSVRPLIKLGLLKSTESQPDIFELTEEGFRICKDYWARSDRDDPTLPKLSLR